MGTSVFDLDAFDAQPQARPRAFDLDAHDAQQAHGGLFSRIVGAPKRLVEIGAGLGAQGLAAVEEPVVRGLASLRGVESAPATQDALAAVERLRAHGQALQAGTESAGQALVQGGLESGALPQPGAPMTLPEKAAAVVFPPLLNETVREHGRAVQRAAVGVVADAGLDPIAHGAMGALRQLGVAGRPLTAATSAVFAYQAGKAVPEEVSRAVEAAKADGGWSPRATEELARAAMSGVMATAGARHALGEAGAMVAPLVPNGGGPIYAADPLARPEQVAELRAAETQRVARQAETDQADADSMRSAGKRLLFERSAALKSQPGAQAELPEAGTPRAAEIQAALDAAAEQLATGSGPRAPEVPRYTKGKNQGQPKLTERQRGMLQKRLLQLWAEEGASPAKPPEKVGPVQETAPQGSVLSRLARRALRAVEPSFEAAERIPGIGPELAGRLRAYADTHERGLGAFEAESVRALQALGERVPEKLNDSPQWKSVQAFLDEQIPLDQVPAEAQPTAQALLDLRAGQRQRAIAAGLISPEQQEANWPRRAIDETRFTEQAKAEQYARDHSVPIEEALARVREGRSQLVAGTRSGRTAGSEFERSATGGLEPGEYRTDVGAWFEAAREMERRIAEAEHLGKNGEKVQELVNRIPGSGKFGGGDRYFAQTLVDRMRDVEPQGALHAASSAVRNFQSAVGLVASPLQQPTTLANTAVEGTVKATIKSVFDTFGREVKGPDGKPMSWTRPIKRMRESLNEARLDAQQRGALYAGTAENLIDAWTKSRQTGAGQGQTSAVSRLPWVKATGHQDTLQRVIAAGAAKYVVPEAWKAAKAGDAAAARSLERWGVDTSAADLTPEMIDRAAKIFSDRAQYKVGTGELPLWASSPWGKVAFQFSSFGYAHARFVGHALNEASRGNVKPIAKLLTIGSAAGYASNQVRHLIFQGKAPENPDEKDFEEAASAAFSKGEHFSPSSPKGLALAAIEGLGAYGGVGALGSLVERVGAGDPAKLLLGPTGADVTALTRLGKAVVSGDGVGKAAANAAAGLAPNLPFGFSPRAIVRELTARKPSDNPDYTGRILDAVQSKAGGTSLPPGSVPAEPVVRTLGETGAAIAKGAAASLGADVPVATYREQQGQLDRDSQAARKAEGEIKSLVTPKPVKPIDKKIEEAAKARKKAELELEMVKAVRRGDMRAVEEIQRRALAAGVNLYGRAARSLSERATSEAAMEAR